LTYHVHPSRAELPENRFEFDLPDGSTYSIPKMKFLKPAIALEVQRNQVVGMTMLFEEYLPEVLQKLDDNEQLLGLMNAWRDASQGDADGEISLGESQASVGS